MNVHGRFLFVHIKLGFKRSVLNLYFTSFVHVVNTFKSIRAGLLTGFLLKKKFQFFSKINKIHSCVIFNWKMHFFLGIHFLFFAECNEPPKANKSPPMRQVVVRPIEPNILDHQGCSAKSERVWLLCQMRQCYCRLNCDHRYWSQELRIKKRRKRFCDLFFFSVLFSCKTIWYLFCARLEWIKDLRIIFYLVIWN